MKRDTIVRVLSVMRALTDESVVASLGGGRARSALLGPLGFLGLGVVMGAGLGALLTPVTGKEARAYARTLMLDWKEKLAMAEEAVAAELRAQRGEIAINGNAG